MKEGEFVARLAPEPVARHQFREGEGHSLLHRATLQPDCYPACFAPCVSQKVRRASLKG